MEEGEDEIGDIYRDRSENKFMCSFLEHFLSDSFVFRNKSYQTFQSHKSSSPKIGWRIMWLKSYGLPFMIVKIWF